MNPSEQKILVIDDDPNVCELIRLYFEKEHFEIVCCDNGLEAASAYIREKPDLIILDLMLPGRDGYDICRAIRRHSDIPIIMLTARTETLDKVVGLELGADDYMQKPFDTKELLARVKALLRRVHYGQNNGDEKMTVRLPGLTVDKQRYLVELRGEIIDMPPKELELLFFMASNPNYVFTREELLGQVWGYDFYGESRTVDVHIKRIREKISEAGSELGWDIKTVWGVGYKFELQQDAG